MALPSIGYNVMCKLVLSKRTDAGPRIITWRSNNLPYLSSSQREHSRLLISRYSRSDTEHDTVDPTFIPLDPGTTNISTNESTR